MSRISRITIAKAVGYSVATIAAVSSYGHQVELLQHAHLDPLFGVVPSEWITPTTVDSLAIIALIVRTSPTATVAMKRAALFPLILAGGLSVAANVATARNLIQVIVGVWTVLAYILAELFVSKLDDKVIVAKPVVLAGSSATITQPVLAVASPVPAPVSPVAVPSVPPVAAPAVVVSAADVTPVVDAPAVPLVVASTRSVVVPVPATAVPPVPVPVVESAIPAPAVKRPTPERATSTTGTRVTVSDAASPVAPVPAAMLARATHIARAHLSATGQPITANELAVRTKVGSATAAQLLAVINGQPDSPTTPAAALNGSSVTAAR